VRAKSASHGGQGAEVQAVEELAQVFVGAVGRGLQPAARLFGGFQQAAGGRFALQPSVQAGLQFLVNHRVGQQTGGAFPQPGFGLVLEQGGEEFEQGLRLKGWHGTPPGWRVAPSIEQVGV